mgnify:CR=1 FL=1
MKSTFVALAAAAAFALGTLPASAAGGGGSMPRTEMPRPSPSPSNQKSQNTETDFEKAEYLIKAEKYDEAVPLLESVVKDNPRDADAWNYLGFANRKLGNKEKALAAYQKALALDPKHKGAHEYLGELYLQMGDLPKAEEQLTLLKGICATNCEEVEDLEADIADYKSQRPAG